MQPRLRFLPISVFSIVLGLSGYTIATQRVFGGQGWGEGFPTVALYATTGVYVLLLILYAVKTVRYGDAVKAEFRHPVMISFFPTLSISLLLLAIAYADVSETLSLVLWSVGAAANLVFTLVVLSIWIRHTRFEIAHFSPAWFIPVVGNLIVPVVGVQHAPADISWLFFAVGLVFAVVLLVVFFYRMVFHQPLHDRHLPTLFILIAPPAVAAVAYVKLTGSYDSFARILYYLAVFFAVFLLVHVRMFARIRFYLSWWAYTFPLAALTIATFLVGKETSSAFYRERRYRPVGRPERARRRPAGPHPGRGGPARDLRARRRRPGPGIGRRRAGGRSSSRWPVRGVRRRAARGIPAPEQGGRRSTTSCCQRARRQGARAAGLRPPRPAHRHPQLRPHRRRHRPARAARRPARLGLRLGPDDVPAAAPRISRDGVRRRRPGRGAAGHPAVPRRRGRALAGARRPCRSRTARSTTCSAAACSSTWPRTSRAVTSAARCASCAACSARAAAC